MKDVKRLSLIPSRPPTRTELVSGIQQSIQQIQKGIPAPKGYSEEVEWKGGAAAWFGGAK